MAKFTVALLLAIVAAVTAHVQNVIPLLGGYTPNYYVKAQPHHGLGYGGLYGGYGLGASRLGLGLGYGYGVGVPGYGLGAIPTYPLSSPKGYRYDGRDHANRALGLY